MLAAAIAADDEEALVVAVTTAERGADITFLTRILEAVLLRLRSPALGRSLELFRYTMVSGRGCD